ncbi:zinc-binding alcohol dehydrogenase [Delphinella strobiligena]|nr:zinc-binding alcohol dehydrogenase [Delphinella strobiligena]
MVFSTEAYVVHEPNGGFHLETVHYKDIGEHEILVENVAVTVCYTDIKAQSGAFLMKPPMIAGHECAGIVKDIGSAVTSLKPGDSVVLSYSPCRACKMCLSGRAPYCSKIRDLNFAGERLDGSSPVTDKDGERLNGHFFGQSSMSRLVLAHENGAVKVEAGREELKRLAALGCGIQTGAGAILNVLRPPINTSIAIFGAGAVGLSACLAAALHSPSHLILIDNSTEKLSQLPKDIHATHIPKVMEITDGQGVDYVIDAVGRPEILKVGQQALAKCGTLLTLGGMPTEAGIRIDLQLIKGITYRGTHQVSRTPCLLMIPHLMSLNRQGRFPFDKFLSYYPFEDLERALEDLKAGKIIKPVLTF